MRYLNEQALDTLDAQAFKAREPYPWVNPEGLLHPQAFESLRRSLPHPSLFQERFGETRRFGQKSHDRLALEYAPDLPIETAWHEFVAELENAPYRRFLARMLGTSRFQLAYHWHYTPRGCSVSPHCDAKRKLGSHIFYFNTEEDWSPDWGGATEILVDHGRFSRKSAPEFEDFDRSIQSEALGNRSLLFVRRGNSWHGVREINAPPGLYRKVFIVVINQRSLKLASFLPRQSQAQIRRRRTSY